MALCIALASVCAPLTWTWPDRRHPTAAQLALDLQNPSQVVLGARAGRAAEMGTSSPQALRAWVAAHADRGSDTLDDLVEWANLASSEALGLLGAEGESMRLRAIGILLERQQPDGCWTIAGAKPPRLASSFLTLRALLALRHYREAREAVAGDAGANPAPYAARPAQK